MRLLYLFLFQFWRVFHEEAFVLLLARADLGLARAPVRGDPRATGSPRNLFALRNLRQ